MKVWWRDISTGMQGLWSGALFVWVGVAAGDVALLVFRSPWWSFSIHAAFCALSILMVVVLGFADPKQFREDSGGLTTGAQISVLLVAVTGGAALFGLMCRDLLAIAGSGFMGTPSGNSRWVWMAYGIDNFLECALVDIPSVYEFQFTKIKPSNFWTQSFVMVFRILVDYVLVVAAVKYFRSLPLRRALDMEKTAHGE